MRAVDYMGEKYPQYFLTSHWKKLKDWLIYSNSGACCYICEKTNTLLLHHVSYKNLFREKLHRDVYVVCYNCHNQIHFSKVFFFFTRKTIMEKKHLLKRMRYLRMIYCVRKSKFFKAGWALLICLIT